MAAWLGLEREDGAWTVTDSSAMRRIIDGIDDPPSQYPSMQLFVGRTAKAQALRSLYPHNNIGRHQKHGFARLHLSSGASSYPLLFIESSLAPEAEPWQPRQEPLRRHHLPSTRDHTCQDVHALLYQCLLLPLVDTVCLFAADFGGIRRVQHLLESWDLVPLAGLDGEGFFRPRLVVVLTDAGDDPVNVEAMENTLQATAVPRLVASVSMVDLRDRHPLSPLSRFEPLRQRLSRELDKARAARSKAHLLFSAVHLEWIFRRLLQHIAQAPSSPFNCINACRPKQTGGDETIQYLGIFLGVAEQVHIPPTSMATFIASAYLMDAYPPGMHGKWYQTKRAHRGVRCG